MSDREELIERLLRKFHGLHTSGESILIAHHHVWSEPACCGNPNRDGGCCGNAIEQEMEAVEVEEIGAMQVGYGDALVELIAALPAFFRSHQEMKEALEPFAAQADARNLNASDEDFMRISVDVHVGDLRRARTTLETLKQKDEG